MGPACHLDAALSLTCDVLVAQNATQLTRRNRDQCPSFQASGRGRVRLWRGLLQYGERSAGAMLFDQAVRCGANAGMLN